MYDIITAVDFAGNRDQKKTSCRTLCLPTAQKLKSMRTKQKHQHCNKKNVYQFVISQETTSLRS